MSFSALNLTAPLLRALTQCGYQTPTPIQQKAIPAILAGQDILASAQTGTGKTAAFALPILHQLLNAPDTESTPVTRTLVLVPTRELAKQVHDSIVTLSAGTSLRCAMIYGGV
ncbi:MAG: DEAD/DEAH box helicase, partial [Plesiomonas sp.]